MPLSLLERIPQKKNFFKKLLSLKELLHTHACPREGRIHWQTTFTRSILCLVIYIICGSLLLDELSKRKTAVGQARSLNAVNVLLWCKSDFVNNTGHEITKYFDLTHNFSSKPTVVFATLCIPYRVPIRTTLFVSSGMSKSMNDMSNFNLIFSIIQAIAVSTNANFWLSVSSDTKDPIFGGRKKPHTSHKTNFTPSCSYAALSHFLHIPGHLWKRDCIHMGG